MAGTPARRSSSAAGRALWWKDVSTTASSIARAVRRSTNAMVSRRSTGGALNSIHSARCCTSRSTPGSSAAAAALLPGVDRLVQHRAEWIEFNAPPVERRETMAFVDLLTALAIDEAVVLTSFHQSALPAALLLRLAGVPAI